MTRFAVTDEAVHLRTGVLFRQQRQARLDRLQAVDVVQPLLARLVGLSELKIEVAGGDGSGGVARVPAGGRRRGAARRAARAGRRAAAPDRRPTPSTHRAEPDAQRSPSAPTRCPLPTSFDAAPEREVYELPMGRLVVATLRSGAVPALVLLAAGIVTARASCRGTSARSFVLLPALVGGAAFVWNRINQGANFRAAISPDGIRLRHGLTETRAQTVPPGRVQAIRLTPEARCGAARTGGASRSTSPATARATSSSGTPCCTRWPRAARRWRRSGSCCPTWASTTRRRLIDAALRRLRRRRRLHGRPARARWVDPVGWRRHGVLVTERALVTRSGRVLAAGRRGAARAHAVARARAGADAAPARAGVVRPALDARARWRRAVEHLDAAVAAALLDEQAARARTARATATPEQWMRRWASRRRRCRPDRRSGPSA